MKTKVKNKTYSEKKINNTSFCCIFAVSILLLTLFDRWTKIMAVSHLKGAPPVVLIKGVLELRYLENHGAAFGMLQNRQVFFWILTMIFFCFALYFFFKVPKTTRYLPLDISIAILTAGAAGNFIDRITLKYVIDYIYFSLIDFPVFNVADIYVSAGVAVLIILVLFFYKEEEFHFLRTGE